MLFFLKLYAKSIILNRFLCLQINPNLTMKQPNTVNQVIKRLAADDSKAFEVLFNQYHKKIYAFALHLVQSEYEAEEIVQNVFTAIWTQRKSIKVSGSFLSYLFGITRHKIYEYLQKKIKHEAFIKFYLENNKGYNFITEEEILYRELEKKVYKLIQSLPVRRRKIFTLSRLDGLSYKEIAKKLDISENTVDTQIRNALDFLRANTD